MVIPICRCSFQSTPVLKRTNLLDTRRLQARRENDSDRWKCDPRLIRFKIARTIRLSKKDDNAKASKSSTRLMERGRRSGKRRRRGLRDNKDIHNYNGIIPGGCNAKQTYFAATCTLERSATLPFPTRLACLAEPTASQLMKYVTEASVIISNTWFRDPARNWEERRVGSTLYRVENIPSAAVARSLDNALNFNSFPMLRHSLFLLVMNTEAFQKNLLIG